MIPREELILRLLAKLSERLDDPITYTRIQKSIYLLNHFLKQELEKDLGYKFDGFLAHSGPYDKNLQRDIDIWLLLKLLNDEGPPLMVEGGPSRFYKTHDLRITTYGKVYLSDQVAQLLQDYLGKNNLQKIENYFLELNTKSESELMKSASELWMRQHPEKSKKVEKFVKSFFSENVTVE